MQRTLLSVYVLAGLICAFAGWMLIGRIGSVSPTSGQTANIESITAVVIGGISFFGGSGSILGMLFGALTVGALGLGLRLAGTDPQWTYLLIGVLIIAAVALDRWIRNGGLSAPVEPILTARASSSATAASPRSTAPISICCPAKFSRSSATTAPASPR